MRRVRLAGSLPLMISASLTAQPAALQPTSKWIVNYADDLCTLERNYGGPGKPLALAFRPDIMGRAQRFFVLSNRPSAEFSGRTVHLAADGKDVPIQAKAYSMRLQDHRLSRGGFNLTEQEMGAIGNASILSVDAGKELRFRFAVPGLAKALVALDACRSDLLTQWGMPPAHQRAFVTSSMPVRNLGSYLKSDDFPSGAEGMSGKVRVRLTIDEAGTVSHCAVVHSSGNKLFDQASCRALQKRARFKPAEDAAGKPIWSFFVEEINWLSE